MFTQALAQVQRGLADAGAFLRANEAARALASQFVAPLEQDMLCAQLDELCRSAPENIQWRVQNHCAAVSRVYAIFENFCEAICADWISTRSLGQKFLNLPVPMQEGYRYGVPVILQQIDKVRYSHLKVSEIVKNFSIALEGQAGFVLTADCLTHHKQNLRWGDIKEIFGRCGVGNAEEWVSKHPLLITYFGGRVSLASQVESRLKQFVQYRNDASHGKVEIDEILGVDELLDYIEFFETLCSSIYELFLQNWVKYIEEGGNIVCVGRISEKYSGRRYVAVCEGVSIAVGDLLICSADAFCRTLEVVSLQVNGQPHQTVIVAGPTEVGLALSKDASLQSQLFRVVNQAD